MKGKAHLTMLEILVSITLKRRFQMSELKKIFQSWSNSQIDSAEIKESWGKIHLYLNQNNGESADTILNELIPVYSKQLEQQAFIQGYKQGVRLFLEITGF